MAAARRRSINSSRQPGVVCELIPTAPIRWWLMRQTHHERVNVEDHEHVNVEELRWFLSLCATENTRTSAEQLGVGQSVLSRGLGRLEGELDAELVSRVGRHLRLNRFGH